MPFYRGWSLLNEVLLVSSSTVNDVLCGNNTLVNLLLGRKWKWKTIDSKLSDAQRRIDIFF